MLYKSTFYLLTYKRQMNFAVWNSRSTRAGTSFPTSCHNSAVEATRKQKCWCCISITWIDYAHLYTKCDNYSTMNRLDSWQRPLLQHNEYKTSVIYCSVAYYTFDSLYRIKHDVEVIELLSERPGRPIALRSIVLNVHSRWVICSTLYYCSSSTKHSSHAFASNFGGSLGSFW